MNEIVPRYEFRAFAHSLAMVAETMRHLSPCQQIEQSSEAYLVSADMHDHNIKMRDGAVDIKRLVERHDGLEQWKPVVKQNFPLSSKFVAETLIPILARPAFVFAASREEYTASKRADQCVVPTASWHLRRIGVQTSLPIHGRPVRGGV